MEFRASYTTFPDVASRTMRPFRPVISATQSEPPNSAINVSRGLPGSPNFDAATKNLRRSSRTSSKPARGHERRGDGVGRREGDAARVPSSSSSCIASSSSSPELSIDMYFVFFVFEDF